MCLKQKQIIYPYIIGVMLRPSQQPKLLGDAFGAGGKGCLLGSLFLVWCRRVSLTELVCQDWLFNCCRFFFFCVLLICQNLFNSSFSKVVVQENSILIYLFINILWAIYSVAREDRENFEIFN